MSIKLKLYLETSVISMYFQDDAPYLRDLTRRFWQEVRPNFEVYISRIVLEEIQATPKIKLKNAMEDVIKDLQVLQLKREIIQLSNLYLRNRRIPRTDALHIAVASFERMDYLVTWNLRHLYKRGTQEMVREINTVRRIAIPTILTPEDFFEEERNA